MTLALALQQLREHEAQQPQRAPEPRPVHLTDDQVAAVDETSQPKEQS